MRWERVWYKEGKWTAKAGVLEQIRAGEPWKGKRGKSGASKETGTSSVRGHCKTEAERESSAGGEQFGKNGLADYHWALKEQCLCGEKLQKWRERKETLNSVHSICLFLFYCQARRTQKRDEKV